MILLCPRKCCFLFRTGILLKSFLPFLRSHTVDNSTRLVLAKGNSLLSCRLPKPVTETIPAKSGHDHQINILHIGALAQMRYKTSAHGRFDFRLRRAVHWSSWSPLTCIRV